MSTDQVGCMVFLGPAAVDRGIKEGAESTEKALLLANISIYTTIKQQQNGFCPSKLKTNTINSLVFFLQITRLVLINYKLGCEI